MLGACSSEAPVSGFDAGTVSSEDAGRVRDAALPDAALSDAAVPSDAGPGITPVSVAHSRELRALWIATVFNINWPSRTGLSAEAQQAELRALFDDAVAAGQNAIVFQVRAEGDAFYASELEPWSRFLTGTMGQDPGYDPLSFAIAEAHARGLELHAWVNPYRALASGNESVASADHSLRRRPGSVVDYGSVHWLNPGDPAAMSHTLAVLEDLLRRYPVDGLHFDDYFYPYPAEGRSFDDAASYAAYQGAGGTLGRSDWRRDNVNRMVAAVRELVSEVRPAARFGISPFGIYRPGMPAGITGLDQYEALFADPLHWMQEGWLDYIAPQLYWPTTQTRQAFGPLLGWWAQQSAAANTELFVGHYLAQLGSAAAWDVDEVIEQLDLVRSETRAGGSIHYHLGPLVENRSGVADAFAARFAAPALSPAFGEAAPPAMPTVAREGRRVVLEAGSDEPLRAFGAYRREGSGWRLEHLWPAYDGRHEAMLDGDDWAFSAFDLNSQESLGVPLQSSGPAPDAGVSLDAGAPDAGVDAGPPGESCTHSFGGVYSHRGCSPSYQCCDGSWGDRGRCGSCVCEEATGREGCSP